MGTKCSCNIMEVTNLNFGEDSDCSNKTRETSYTLSSSEDAEATEYEYETNAESNSDSDDASSTSYSITETELEPESNNRRIPPMPRTRSSRSSRRSVSHSNINPDEGAGYISNGGSSITDVSDLTNSDLADLDYATDLAQAGSSSMMTPSTSMSVSTTCSSSSAITPIPSPSPFEIIRAVQMKQNLIRDQLHGHGRRHSLPLNVVQNQIRGQLSTINVQNANWNMPRSQSHRDQNQHQHIPGHRLSHSSGPPRSPLSAPPRDKGNKLNVEIRIEDLYEQTSDDYEPVDVYAQFRNIAQNITRNNEMKMNKNTNTNSKPGHPAMKINVNMNVLAALNYARNITVTPPSPAKTNTITVEPSTHLSDNSTNSIEEALEKIPTIPNVGNIADVGNAGLSFEASTSDSISSDDGTYSPVSDSNYNMTDEEYVGDNDDDDLYSALFIDNNNGHTQTKSKHHKKKSKLRGRARTRPWAAHSRDRSRSRSRSNRIHLMIASDDEDEKELELLNQQNVKNNVPIKHIQLNSKRPVSPKSPLAAVVMTHERNMSVPILSPTTSISHSAQNSAMSLAVDELLLTNKVSVATDDEKEDVLDDELLPLTNVTPTHSFDTAIEPKVRAKQEIASNDKLKENEDQKELITTPTNDDISGQKIPITPPLNSMNHNDTISLQMALTEKEDQDQDQDTVDCDDKALQDKQLNLSPVSFSNSNSASSNSINLSLSENMKENIDKADGLSPGANLINLTSSHSNNYNQTFF